MGGSGRKRRPVAVVLSLEALVLCWPEAESKYEYPATPLYSSVWPECTTSAWWVSEVHAADTSQGRCRLCYGGGIEAAASGDRLAWSLGSDMPYRPILAMQF